MKILNKSKDGGDLSTVYAYWLVEIKSLFSIVLLKFEGDSRECYHTHAFNSISWLLYGKLTEYFLNGTYKEYYPSIFPIITKREPFHKVSSTNNSYVISFRGKWLNVWKENTQEAGSYYLTHGRKLLTNIKNML